MQSVALKIIKVKSPSEKAKILAEFNPGTSTWVVSDLVSRSAIQKNILDKFGFVEASACMRVSDLWQHLLFSVRPDIRVVSPALAKALIRNWLTESEYDFAKTPGASETIIHYLTELVPLLSHPESQNVMLPWFEENQGAFVRWGLWFREATRLWKRFSQEKLIARNWICGFLVNEPGFEKNFSRALIFDLGVDVLAPELELMNGLSRFQEVVRLVPDPDWGPELAQTQNWKGERIEYRRFSSPLGEIKDAVNCIRGWIDDGVPFEKIAVLAPNRKRIWSTFAEFLKHEGIPVREVEPDPMSAHGHVAQLMSRLELKNGKVTTDKLELDLFHAEEAKKIFTNYNEFSRIFSFLYESKDLYRHSEVAHAYEARVSETALSAKDFLKQISNLWEDEWPSELIERLFSEILKDVPTDLILDKQNWISYLGELTRSIDLPEQAKSQEGIYLENYFSAEHLSVSHVYFLNVTDSQFRKARRTSILDEDLKSLSRTLGFSLVVNDPNIPEYTAKWILSKDFSRNILSYADSDFSGQPEAPSFFWLQGAIANNFDPKKITEPGKTVWDSLQESMTLTNGLDIEKNFDGAIHLSATALSNYNRCPFIFYAENLLRLEVPEGVDFDLGYRDLGQLLHFIMEKIILDKKGLAASKEEISCLVDEWAKENRFPIPDENLWREQKRKFFPYVQKFLETERYWRQRFPLTKTVGVELKISAEIPSSIGPIKLSGKIDRVDTDGNGNFAVIDYKRSGASISTLDSWSQDKVYQPLFYTLALESGWTALGKKHVSTGQFYFLKDGDRSRAYYVVEDAGTLYDVEDSKKNKISLEEKKNLVNEMLSVINTTAEGIRKGKFLPQPSDEKTCEKCTWRYSCRAKHLM
ncbi:MAG: hypothetical protein A4S09_15910 [Proteobacteria bacterium SG_bin7]|nr:MAG: hypothetical protein A4S09_15910 [Proteobacteria bacterium SG_bin7]